MQTELENMFQWLLDVSSSTWKRQVYMCLRPPWTLGVVLDMFVPEGIRKDRVLSFFAKLACCLEKGICRDLVKKYKHLGVRAIEPGSKFLIMLVLLFANKTNNIEAENNFARSTAARAYMQGKKHECATMASKHTVAETHHQHLLSLGKSKNNDAMKREAIKLSTTPAAADVLAGSGRIGDAINAALSIVSPPAKPEKDAKAIVKTNGYILLTNELFESEPLLVGETANDRRKRVVAKATPACTKSQAVYHHMDSNLDPNPGPNLYEFIGLAAMDGKFPY